MAGALQLLKALSEPVRIRFYLLLRQSSLTVSELSEILAVSQSNTSHHIKALRELDLLTAERTGQHTYYALNRETVSAPRIAAILKSLENAADEIPEILSDTTRLRNVLASRAADTFARWRMEQPDLPYTDIFAHLAAGKRGRALDIGCGEGDFFDALRMSFDEVIAVDIDREHLRRARDRATAGTSILCANALELPLATASCDAVVLRMALSQIEDRTVVLSEASRIVNAGGFVSIIDSDADSNRDLKHMVSRFFASTPGMAIDAERVLPRLFMLRARRTHSF